MNTRREFFQNSLLSFGILPLFNRFDISNNDLEPRWDIANRVCDIFILQMKERIKSQTKNIDSIGIYWDNRIHDHTRVGIYGYGYSHNDIIVGARVDWLKKYNVSTDLIIDALCQCYLLNQGYSRSETIIGSNNYGSSEWGVRVYKENK